MSRYTAASDLDYYDEPWNRPEPPPLQVICVWCEPAHVVREGRTPASHGMCPAAVARQLPQLDADDALLAERQK